ncbi:flagellin N-terminal helical domain-containing protein [Bacillus shivajii]|uniref:flagellin N-terminal helical domain-containing protein n=1 Tax=Bacillus shivajii TaxID=1983719 RepID=UPI00299E3224|nr:flagellin [Bacillus shivajii]
MKINNNIQALNAYRNLNQNQFQTSKNLEKLSSGLRINRASDDAAGLAISEKMRSQIRGLQMAERNAMDGISLLQTAEGAMTEVHSMLQRMRELAVQGANDTNTDQDRAEIQKEIRQLQTEIDSVAEKTEFNTRKLLNGSSAVLSVVDYNHTNVVGLPEVIDPNVESGRYAVDVGPDHEIKYNITQPAAGLKDEGDIEFDPNVKNQALGEYTINVREYNEDNGNTGATIEVLGPNGLPVEDGKRAVAVGPGADEQHQTIGGLKIDVSKINGSGTAKVTMEAEATFTVSKDRNEQTPTYREAEVDGRFINVPVVNQGDQDTTVENVLNADTQLGMPSQGEDGGLPSGYEKLAVLEPMLMSNEPELDKDGNPVNLKASTQSAESINLDGNFGNFTDIKDEFLEELEDDISAAKTEGVEYVDQAVEAAFQAAKNSALAGKTNEAIIEDAINAATQTLEDNNDLDNGDVVSAIGTLIGKIDEAMTTFGDDNEHIGDLFKPIVEEAVTGDETKLESEYESTYFSVTNSDGEDRLFRVAQEQLGVDGPKAVVNSSTGVVSINTEADPKVTTNDVRNALVADGYSGVQAWSVAGDDTKVERDMLVVTNNTNEDSSPIVREPYVVSTAQYEPVAFSKTLTTVNGKIEHGGVEFTFNSDIREGKSEYSVINNALSFQIGPNTNQNVMIDVSELNTVRLGIDEVSVHTQDGANDAIHSIDQAIQNVSSIRAKLGATQNRMEHTINNLQVTQENLTSAESRIRDADMALEMTEFTRNNILNQSATAMLAQANQLPQGVLQLLQ